MSDTPKYPPLVLGPKSIAGLHRAAIEVMERRHPHLRFRIVSDEPNPAVGGAGARGEDGTVIDHG